MDPKLKHGHQQSEENHCLDH